MTISIVIGVISILMLGGLLAIGVYREAQLVQSNEAGAEAGRVVVQLQRETLRLMALVNADPEIFDSDAVEFQRNLLVSRFDVARRPVTRSYIPAEILSRLEEVETMWVDMQPLLDSWQADPRNTEVQAELVGKLADMEFAMNEAEINFHRVRVNTLIDISRASQQWLLLLGISSLLLIGFIGVMSVNLYRVVRQRQEAEAAEAAARESNRLKSEFLATMSHELRTPLNGVIGYADFLMDAMGGDFNEKQTDYLRRILSNGERLLRLVDDILDVSRIEAGRLELVDASFSPIEMMDRIKPELQAQATKKGLELRIRIDPTLPDRLVGDRERLGQVVINLVTNAIKFTQVGYIAVRLERLSEARWAISVEDTGIGIPPQAQEYIFEKFRQVDGTLERAHGGAGLGLHIVRSLAILMGGSVRLKSDLGKGSTFTVELPIVVAEKEAVK